MNHYEQRLEQDLSRIRDLLQSMAGQVETALDNSTGSLLVRDEDVAYDTVLRDYPINRKSREIDRLCHAFIARHLPSAGHLRWISSVIRVNVALERIGDYAVTICREALQLKQLPSDVIAMEVKNLSDETKTLLHQAIRTFIEGNSEMARAIGPMADHVEDIMDEIYAHLISVEGKWDLREIIAAFVVFNLLKRISDQAKNISEQTRFAVAGEVKATRIFNILFLDEGNDGLSQIAEAMARKLFPNSATYSSAGKRPVRALDPELLAFLDGNGVDTESLSITGTESIRHKLSEFDVVVALVGRVRDYFPEVPFHTSALNWDLAEELDETRSASAGEGFQAEYRVLADRIEQLMHILVGTKAD